MDARVVSGSGRGTVSGMVSDTMPDTMPDNTRYPNPSSAARLPAASYTTVSIQSPRRYFHCRIEA